MMNQGNSGGSQAAEKVTPAKMDAALKAKWVEALRSGNYKQTIGSLKSGDSYCCLGVLCNIAGIPIDPGGKFPLIPERSYAPIFALVGGEAASKECSSRNDGHKGRRWSFSDLADYIEKNL